MYYVKEQMGGVLCSLHTLPRAIMILSKVCHGSVLNYTFLGLDCDLFPVQESTIDDHEPKTTYPR